MRRAHYFLAIALCLIASVCAFLVHKHQSSRCNERGRAFSARADKLEKDAVDTLKIGTSKDAVFQFFNANGIPPDFVGHEITGTIHVEGCSPTGCGTDDALLGIRVEVDEHGIVVGPPHIGALYTNCL